MANWFQDLPGLIEENNKTKFPPELVILPYELMLDLSTAAFHIVYWMCVTAKEGSPPSLRHLFDSLLPTDKIEDFTMGFTDLLSLGYISVAEDDHDESSYKVLFTHHCEVALRTGEIDRLKEKCLSGDLEDREELSMYASAVLFKCRIISADAWVGTCDAFLTSSDIRLSKIFKKRGFDKQTNAIVLYVTLMKRIEGANTDITLLSQLFSINSMEARRLHKYWKSQSWKPIQKGILYTRQFPMCPATLSPTEDFTRPLEGSVIESPAVTNYQLPSSLIRVHPSAIKPKQLFYNQAESKEVDMLTKILHQTAFKKYRQQQEKQIGGQSGISVLLSGDPGTGKTELARQLARISGRDLLFFNVSEQRDKFYGESEKRIKEVFDCYRRLVNNAKKEPILFFNEADSVIHKRHSGGSNTSNTENAIQTILLNELETFTGILICTTNRPNSFDEAFSRRFPTQISIMPPDESTRALLLQHYFNELSVDVRRDLAQRYEFTAAELDNFMRRNLMNLAVGEQAGPLDAALEDYFLSLRKSVRAPIGYKL